MADNKNYYVFCDDNCKFEAMTKEQILTAIEQAITTGAVQDVDTGFITKIKEQNKNVGLKFWIGTQAEYNALATKENNCFYIITDDTAKEDIETAIGNLQREMNTLNEYVGAFTEQVNENVCALLWTGDYDTMGLFESGAITTNYIELHESEKVLEKYNAFIVEIGGKCKKLSYATDGSLTETIVMLNKCKILCTVGKHIDGADDAYEYDGDCLFGAATKCVRALSTINNYWLRTSEITYFVSFAIEENQRRIKPISAMASLRRIIEAEKNPQHIYAGLNIYNIWGVNAPFNGSN